MAPALIDSRRGGRWLGIEPHALRLRDRGISLTAVLDLDDVVVRLPQLWLPEVAAIWLESPNAHVPLYRRDLRPRRR